MKINIEDYNKWDYSDWTVGTIVPQDFPTISAINCNYSILNGIDPFYNNTNMMNWEVNSNLLCNGGIAVTKNIIVDSENIYRISFWLKHNIQGTGTQQLLIFRTYGRNEAGTSSGLTNISTGVFTVTPNIVNTYSPLQLYNNEWLLVVAHVFPISWTGTTNHIDSGIYSNNIKITGITWQDFKIDSSTYQISSRIYAPYGTNRSGTTTNICYPRVDVVDGTEPSISTLLNNEGQWREQNTGNTYINLEDNNLLDYSDWDTNLSGSTTHFEEYVVNSVANRVDSIDPFGNNIKVWQNTATAPVFSGGWNTILIACDPNKMYRFSQWVNRKVIGTDGLCYFGYYVFDGNGSRTTSVRISDNLVHNNFYFLSNNFNIISSYMPENEWVLMIGYIMPQTYTGSTNSDYYGQVYNTGGTLLNKPSIYTHYKFNSGVTTAYIKHRTYSPYKETNTNAINQMCYPRIDVVDGTEPSIATLLSNEGQWRKINDMKINIGDDWKNTI